MDVPDEMTEAHRLADDAVCRLIEHVDAVTIFISKRRTDGRNGTWSCSFGAGNWYARYGHIKQWVLAE